MVSATVNIARNVVGVIGNIISLLLFLSPMPTFVDIAKKGSVEQYSPTPYLVTLVNCAVWVLYGLPMVHPHSILVVTINGTGTAIELVYIALFFFYSPDKKQRLKIVVVLLIEIIFFTAVTVLVLTLLHTTKQRSLVVGIICIAFNIMMYASPLSVMKLVITTKSVEYMPLLLSLGSLGNGVSWFIYSFLPFDLFIAIPNGLGTAFSIAQLILYGSYYKSTQRLKAARRQGNGELDMPVVVVSGDSSKISSATVLNGHRGPEINGA